MRQTLGPARLFAAVMAALLPVTATAAPIGFTRMQGNVSQRARPSFDRGRVPASTPQQHILMMLRRPAARQVALQQFSARQYDPRSADFHHWLTPQQFGEQFGPSAPDIDKVTHWLSQHGFKINSVPAGGLFVDFSGSAGQVEEAFHTEMHRYRVNGEDHIANSSDPYLPASLAPLVSGFRALNDFRPRSHLTHLGVAHLDRPSKQWRGEGAHLTSAANGLYIAGPRDFAKIYSVDQVWGEHVVGTGQTIAVVGEVNPASADIQTFRDQFGITALGPNGSVQIENPPTSVCAAPDPSRNEPEGYLDAEWAGAMAPDATVDYVSCGREGLTSGADLAAAYVIGDAAHVQKISVLSTSYGDCEADPQSEANQFYVSLWQQAAVEGITVVVASGDTGGDGCQYVGSYATDGLTVVNEASTAYNIAAGGTDFSDVFSGSTATYWAAANGANFESAQSYIPEMTWNESCASPLVLAHFGSSYADSYGPNGFCTYAAEQSVDPNTGFSPYANAFAGSGGLSTVSARPAWQTGVPGIPLGAGRAVPDIAMFASGGYTWAQTLILCDSGLLDMPAGTACDFTNANDVYANYGGGTSFVAPAFAGVMALINEKSGQRQGQANYVLYPLAGEQYVTYAGATQPSLANCAAYLGPQALSGCYFHDVSATPTSGPTPFVTGKTAVPCTGTATAAGTFTDTSTDAASNNENCYGYQITVTDNGGTLTTTPNYYGVLSTAGNATSAAFSAGPGYDLATGLGSPNVYSLVNAPQWSGGGLATNVALGTTVSGQMLRLSATVTDQSRLPVLGGTVTFYSGNTALGTVNKACSPRGVFGLPVLVSALGSSAPGGTGTYQNIFASFAGGAQSCQGKTAVYYGSQSAPATVVFSNTPLHLYPSVPKPFGVMR